MPDLLRDTIVRMEKDFDGWNAAKKQTHDKADYLPLYHERQIRWCRLGINVGFEQDGTGEGFSRPVLVLKAFSRRVCLVVPLTTSQKKNRYHFSVGQVADREAFAIISQLRLIDTRRLYLLVHTLDKGMFNTIRKAIKDML